MTGRMTPSNDKPMVTSMADVGIRKAMFEEFKTLDDDIKTVKKLKVMVGVFQRIKRENPVAYNRMVKFFDENEKAHRIRRELRLLGKKNKVEALEQKLDSSVKCHPKSGKELIQMFVRGLSDLYPDMTKLLLKELEGAMDSKSMRKTPSKRPAKEVDKKITTKIVSMTGTPNNHICTTQCTTADCKKCPDSTTVCCTKACSTTSAPSCRTSIECEDYCKQKFSGRVCKEEHNDETGDIRVHPTARACQNTEQLYIQTKSKSLQNENLTITAPFKDFQVQGSIMFSNPSKPVKKSIPKVLEQSYNAIEPIMEKARLTENWRGWYPRSDSVNIVSSLEGSGSSVDAIRQLGQPAVDSEKANHAKAIWKPSGESVEAEQIPQPDSTKNNAMLDLYPTAFPNRRNKKRSMYVLYE